ncbi:E3 ubiquitin- ligase DZIP3 [Paramuricea clavata]|uniref:E3 ubiquitin- ligase DZIP3 n=1 Tax=Paramuricea clavata TaxID=317549 RepID=A0A7D9JKC1_PARCT|nr:E3 ubiquitin- ligase DZIP3 [Paramuricea clavata]
MDDLTKKKRVRGGHRASASKLVAKIMEAIPKASPESPEKDLVWLRQSQITLRDKINMLKELDEQVIDILSASKDEDVDEQLGKEIEDSDEAIAELERTLLQLNDALGKLGGQSLMPMLTQTNLTSAEGNLDQSHVSISSAGKIIRAKLPKLRLRNFGGKICEWPEFWHGFSSSMDNNDQLSDVDKFAYLHGYLEGPAKSTIAGLSLTGANYKCAVELLKKRFEKKNAVQRAHVNELKQLPAVYKERDTQRLRKLYDSCEANNRTLKALGVNEDSYSAIVVPTIMEKLPEQFRLTIT